MTTPPLLARTPLHEWHLAHGARFVERSGWSQVAGYSDPKREAEAVQSGVGLVDLSGRAKLTLLGRGVAQAVHEVLGLVQQPPPCSVLAFTAEGPALACQVTADHGLLLASTPGSLQFRDLAERLASRGGIVPVDATTAYAGIGLVGPEGVELLRRLTAFDVTLRNFPPGSCAATNLAGVHALLVRPPAGVMPEMSVYIGWDVGEYVWERLLDAGRALGVTAVGLGALLGE